MVQSVAMRIGESKTALLPTHERGSQPAATFVRLSQLCKLAECEQVAAVCYRVRNGEIEFLLVQTRGGGRWTFPKGNVEPGLTHAQVAALEAFEEAGVHGRMEEAAFTHYRGRKRSRERNSFTRSGDASISVNAHLCQVLRLSAPKERNRNRTWFLMGEAKVRLREGRDKVDAERLIRVIEKAAARIKSSIQKGDDFHLAPQSMLRTIQKDELQQVHFEPLARYRGGSRLSADLKSVEVRESLQGRILQFSAEREANRNPKLSFGWKKTKALGTGSKNA